MVEIKDTTITLTRGDTLKLKLDLKNADGTEYVPATGDVVKVGVKADYSDTTCVIEKTVPNDTLILHLVPNDTKTLAFGSYVWDAQITFANGDVNTFIAKAKFKIAEEVV